MVVAEDLVGVPSQRAPTHQPAALLNACAILQALKRHSQTLQAALAAVGTSRILTIAVFHTALDHSPPNSWSLLVTTRLGVLLDPLALFNCHSLLHWASW